MAALGATSSKLFVECPIVGSLENWKVTYPLVVYRGRPKITGTCPRHRIDSTQVTVLGPASLLARCKTIPREYLAECPDEDGPERELSCEEYIRIVCKVLGLSAPRQCLVDEKKCDEEIGEASINGVYETGG